MISIFNRYTTATLIRAGVNELTVARSLVFPIATPAHRLRIFIAPSAEGSVACARCRDKMFNFRYK